LKPENRLKLLKEFLTKEILLESIICLQEVSRDWADKLLVFFRNHHYTFSNTSYGNKSTGFMGVAIAFPECYDLLDCNTKRIADDIIETPSEPETWLTKIPYFGSWFKPTVSEEQLDTIEAKNKFNTLYSIKLKRNKCFFWVSTYHMPCAFTKPTIMKLHAECVRTHFLKLTGNTLGFLCGDFNTTPEQIAYAIINKQSLFDVFDECERPISYHSTNTSGSFCDTIDYIWYYDPQCFIKAVGTDVPVVENDIPDAKQPSDHIPIIADFTL